MCDEVEEALEEREGQSVELCLNRMRVFLDQVELAKKADRKEAAKIQGMIEMVLEVFFSEEESEDPEDEDDYEGEEDEEEDDDD
jgi:hypothetical protein